ncbi:MAG: hypothetical protein ACR2GY_13075 [Phycisphaerales bacterium]
MQTAVNHHFAVALKELQTGVTICCWVIGLALLIQTVGWSLISFTDIRYANHEAIALPASGDTAVVTAEELRRQNLATPHAVDSEIVTADVNRQFAPADHVLRILTSLAAAVGTMAALALLPLLALAVVLGAGAATPGVDRAAGAFVWAVVLIIVTLPWGRLFEGVPFDGLFANYASMAADVELWQSGVATTGVERATSGGLLFIGRYCVLPLACVAGIAAVGLRFRAGIAAGLIPKADYRLDPELEKEVADLKATSLIGGGGRMAGALKAIRVEDQPTRTLKQGSPGTHPGRPI